MSRVSLALSPRPPNNRAPLRTAKKNRAGRRTVPRRKRERSRSVTQVTVNGKQQPTGPHRAPSTSDVAEGRTMRAVVVNEYGGAPAVTEVPTPQPGPGQVLIRLRAAGMNPMDRSLASGDWRPMPAIFPMVLGADGAGVVERVGVGATRFSAGQSAFGQMLIAPLGSAATYAEYVAVTEDAPLALVPDGLDFVLASALPTAGMAGLSLVELLGPLTGKTVLIVGARVVSAPLPLSSL
jgi:hypothetical protein